MPKADRGKHDRACTETPIADGEPCAGELLDDLEVHLVGLPSAAGLLGVRQAEEPGRSEGAEDVAREGTRGLGLVDPRSQLAVDEVVDESEKVARLVRGESPLHREGHGCS